MGESHRENEGELRLVVRASFSQEELRELFGAWSLSDPTERDGADLARALVREGTRKLGPSELVRRLRDRKPLVEWPDPGDAPPLSDATWVDPPPTSNRRDPPLGGGSQGAGPTEERSAEGGLDAPPTSRGEAWPGLGTAPATPPRAATNRWVVVSVGLGVALALVAFVAGYAWSRRAPASGHTEHQRGVPITGLAMDILSAELRGVEIGCRLEPRESVTRAILGDAQAECGVKRFTPDPPSRATIPETTRTPVAAPPPPREGRPTKLPAIPGASCLQGCGSKRAQCESSCGAEPRDASLYDAFQGCRSKCVASDSRCRLSCQ